MDRVKARAIYDYGHVLHDLQLNGWVLAWRRLLGETLIQWHGETEIDPPTDLRRDPPDPFLHVHSDSDRYAENVRDERPRLLRPDASWSSTAPAAASTRTTTSSGATTAS